VDGSHLPTGIVLHSGGRSRRHLLDDGIRDLLENSARRFARCQPHRRRSSVARASLAG
jgi:hypothetical protein